MSVSKWAYDPEKCDHGVCVGDCDLCERGEELAIHSMCQIIAKFLDRHKDKTIRSYVHIVNGEWRYEVEIVEKKVLLK